MFENFQNFNEAILITMTTQSSLVKIVIWDIHKNQTHTHFKETMQNHLCRKKVM